MVYITGVPLDNPYSNPHYIIICIYITSYSLILLSYILVLYNKFLFDRYLVIFKVVVLSLSLLLDSLTMIITFKFQPEFFKYLWSKLYMNGWPGPSGSNGSPNGGPGGPNGGPGGPNGGPGGPNGPLGPLMETIFKNRREKEKKENWDHQNHEDKKEIWKRQSYKVSSINGTLIENKEKLRKVNIEIARTQHEWDTLNKNVHEDRTDTSNNMPGNTDPGILGSRIFEYTSKSRALSEKLVELEYQERRYSARVDRGTVELFNAKQEFIKYNQDNNIVNTRLRWMKK